MKLNFKPALILLGISIFVKSGLAQNENNNPQPTANANDSAQHFVWEAATTDIKEIKMGELALQKSDNADVKAFAEHIIADHKKACKKLHGIAESEGLQFPDTNAVSITEEEHRGGRMHPQWNADMTNDSDTNVFLTAHMERGGHLATNTDGIITTNWDNSDTNNYPGSTAAIPRGQDSITNAPIDTSSNFDGKAYVSSAVTRGQHIATNMDDEISTNRTHHPMMNLATLSGPEFDRAYAKKMVMGHEQAIRKFQKAADELQDPKLKKYAEKTLPTLRAHLRMAEELRSKLGVDMGMTNSVSTDH